MNIGVLSDIHSNCFALKAVINDFEKYNIKKMFILGDIFGYYPWACETYELLEPFIKEAYCIKGNHDQLLIVKSPPKEVPSYWKAAKLNEKELKRQKPEGIAWLNSLKFSQSFNLNGKTIKLVHGTPDNPSKGRFYPDNNNDYSWMPIENELLFMGHSHYPMIKTSNNSGKLYNPGSVGQPRDGNPMPSWGILSLENFSFSLIRSNYDNISVIRKLKKLNWDKRAILALNKNSKGELNQTFKVNND